MVDSGLGNDCNLQVHCDGGLCPAEAASAAAYIITAWSAVDGIWQRKPIAHGGMFLADGVVSSFMAEAVALEEACKFLSEFVSCG